MDRREFCLNAFLASAALSAPRICCASGDIDGHIILVELTGANDGLNTVIPVKNDRYYSLRPEIGVNRHDVLSLDDDQGLHPSLRGIRSLYETGDLRIFQNVGYPEQIQSHFRSIEIWERGGDGRANGRKGWRSSRPSAMPARSHPRIRRTALCTTRPTRAWLLFPHVATSLGVRLSHAAKLQRQSRGCTVRPTSCSHSGRPRPPPRRPSRHPSRRPAAFARVPRSLGRIRSVKSRSESVPEGAQVLSCAALRSCRRAVQPVLPQQASFWPK